MTRRCASCGAGDLPGESRYCLRCGARLAAPAGSGEAGAYTPEHLADVLATASAREGERKDVSVLVADVAGSLAMAHRLDPEDLHALMNGFFALALDAVHAESGLLNQFRGDGFMALFGAPQARPHHARDAVRAALAIRRAAESYTRSVRARFRVPLVLRMGVHSGAVWVGSIGGRLRRDYTAEGPTVGLAARLEQAADPGQILISAETERRVRGFFEVSALGSLSLRGSPAAIEAFEVIGPGAHESPLDLERATGLVPLAGRDEPIAVALDRLDSVSPGAALWLELVGEAGIGKSRLALEIRLREGGAWLEGRCGESSATRAYDAWLDLLRRWPEPGADRARALARRLAGVEGEIEPAAGEQALRALLEGAAPGPRPLSILFEDVQWLDGPSRRLVQALLAHPPARGVRFLATRRSEPGIGAEAELPGAERIALGPLDPAHSHALALAVLAGRDWPEPLALLACERGGGHPLYVLEVARALAEGSEELREAARLEASWRQAHARLPDTLRGVIAARIDALPEPAKQLLEVAAVVGRGLAPTLLAQLAATPEAAIRARLGQLVERSLLVASGDGFDFAHLLHREVAYEQMLLQRRRELHRHCARLLAEDPEASRPEAASEIGRHHDQAGEARPAAQALARAGMGYLRLHAAREATSHLRRAWELLQASALAEVEPSLRLQVGLGLAKALNTLDRAGEAASVLEALAPDELSGEDRSRLADAWIEGAWVRFSEGGEVTRSLALLERGLALVRGEPVVEARAHAYRIRICHLDGAIEAAAESARRMAELATAGGDRFATAFGIGNEGYVRCDAGEVELALERCEEAYELVHEVRHEVGQGFAAGWLAKVHAYRGDCEAALRAADHARELGRRTAQAGVVYNAEIWTGLVHLLLDEPKQAAEVLERLAGINDRWPTTLDWLALARLETGRLPEAIDLARRCLAAEPPRLVRLRALRTLGLAHGLSRHPDREAAERAVGESLGLALELGLRPHVAEAHHALAELCRRAGDARRASYYAERAEREWLACGMPLHAERARRAEG